MAECRSGKIRGGGAAAASYALLNFELIFKENWVVFDSEESTSILLPRKLHFRTSDF